MSTLVQRHTNDELTQDDDDVGDDHKKEDEEDDAGGHWVQQASPVIAFIQRIRDLVYPWLSLLYWLGAWNLCDTYFLPEWAYKRDLLLTVFCAERWLPIPSEWVDGEQGDSMQLACQARAWTISVVHFAANTVFWTGAWNLFDIHWLVSSVRREVWYLLVGMAAWFLCDVLLSDHSLMCWSGRPPASSSSPSHVSARARAPVRVRGRRECEQDVPLA